MKKKQQTNSPCIRHGQISVAIGRDYFNLLSRCNSQITLLRRIFRAARRTTEESTETRGRVVETGHANDVS